MQIVLLARAALIFTGWRRLRCRWHQVAALGNFPRLHL